MLDLLDGRETERTALRMVRDQAAAVPARAVRLRRRRSSPVGRSAAADRNGGKRNLWLRSLDRMGLGFDS